MIQSRVLLVPVFLIGCAGHAFGQHAAAPDAIDAGAAWNKLMVGNTRYVSGHLDHPRQSVERRASLAASQRPFAIVLSCADSRVPPEVVFDQGLGDLFTVRVAGNVATDDVIASLEYAVAHLGPKLIVVLGHERCGAVDATLKGGAPEGHLAALMDRIKPATDAARNQTGDKLDSAVRFNVLNTVRQLKDSQPILGENVKSAGLKILGARYDLDTGKIELVQ